MSAIDYAFGLFICIAIIVAMAAIYRSIKMGDE